MATYRVTFETVLAQTVEVDADDLEDGIEEAYDHLGSVPFIGWDFDASGDWNPVYVYNNDTGEGTDVSSDWF